MSRCRSVRQEFLRAGEVSANQDTNFKNVYLFQIPIILVNILNQACSFMIKNRQELKYVSKKSKGYVFLPTIHIELLLSRNEETVTTMNCYFYCLIAYKKLTPNI